MMSTYPILRGQLERQLLHWELATTELARLEHTASPQAWASLERYVGVSLRKRLNEAALQLRREAAVVRAMAEAAREAQDLDAVWQRLYQFRERYLRTETMLDYYGQAVNTRTNESLSANLRAMDVLAWRSMTQLLDQLGKQSPPVLTYLDKGLGASILKAGLRLWDGTISPVATIKVTYHNRRRPTALIHETGHQVAHILDWNSELSTTLSNTLRTHPQCASVWSSWSSEVAADCFGFVHTGYAAVAALSDVVAGESATVFRYQLGDPHPVSYLRVLLGVEMCRCFYGRGAWDELGAAWVERYSLSLADPAVRDLISVSRPLLASIVETCLLKPMRAFSQRPLADRIDPGRVSPASLRALEVSAGESLFTSSRWIWMECVRLIGLTGYLFAAETAGSRRAAELQDHLMTRLGEAVATMSVVVS